MKTLQQKFNDEIVSLRKKIPDEYNKAMLLDYITDPNVDLMSSITTRGDGKSYNYFNMMMQLAQKFDEFKLTIITRHFTLRTVMADLLEKILTEQKYKRDDIYFKTTPHYIMLYIKKKPVAIISDLNAVSDLKYASNILKDYKFIVYDEFLALNGDYLPDEPQRLQTLYESIDRGLNDLLPNPKILLLGNPVNFDSPLLSYWSLFNMLEKQPMNTIIQNGNIVQERFKNDNVNAKKNHRLFVDENGSISGEFKTNTLLIAPESLKLAYTSSIIIKLKDSQYLTVHYNPDPTSSNNEYYIQVDGTPKNIYDYCFNLVDVNPKTRLIDPERDMHESNVYKYQKNKILFSDTFSINYVDKENYIMYISISHLIARAKRVANTDPYAFAKVTEKQSEQSRLKNLKQKLFAEYLGGY